MVAVAAPKKNFRGFTKKVEYIDLTKKKKMQIHYILQLIRDDSDERYISLIFLLGIGFAKIYGFFFFFRALCQGYRYRIGRCLCLIKEIKYFGTN